jgi:outer membrane protein assembly factor BamB
VRWARKNRRQVLLLGLTALVSVGLAVGGAVAVVHHRDSEKQRIKQETDDKHAHVWMTTKGPPLVVEVLNDVGEQVTKVAVPNETSVVLWPGTYTLRISGPWKGTETRPLTVSPGQRMDVAVEASGEVMVTTDGPPLVGELQNGDGEAVVPPFPIPTEKPVVVPTGNYRMKLRGPWLPVEYEPLHVSAGEQRKLELKLVGQLSLDSNGPPLMAEVLNGKGERVVPAFTLPTPDPVALPAGDHRLRLTRSGLWTETYDFTLRRGELASRSLDLGDRTFGTPIKFTYPPNGSDPADAWVITAGGKAHVIQVTREGLRRIEWATGRQVWSEVPAHPDLDAAPYSGPSPAGKWGAFFHSRLLHLGDTDPLPVQARLVRPAPDLDGDGEPDLLFVSRWVPGVMAVSGKTGKVLWYHTTLPPVPEEMRKAGWKPLPQPDYVPMGEPVLCDIDGDGVLDVITAVHARGVHWRNPETKETKFADSGVWLEALSGKTGKLLWTAWVEEPVKPLDGLRPYAAHLTKLDGKAVLAVLSGPSMGTFDVMTGKLLSGPIALNFTPLGVPKVRAGERPLFLLGRKAAGGDELVAVDALDGKVRWAHALGFSWPKVRSDDDTGFPSGNPHVSPPGWPEVAALDGDGADVVLVPLAHKTNSMWEDRSGGGVVALDVDTGKPKWEYRFPPPPHGFQNGYCRLRVIPDVTGDGKPDVAVARCHWTIYSSAEGSGKHTEIAVSVLSGSDGKPVWTWNRNTAGTDRYFNERPGLGRLTTWGLGRDGKPQLVLAVYPVGAGTADLLLFDSKTGRFDREVKQFGEPFAADLEGDGLNGLYAYQPGAPGSPFMTGFSLGALRGTCPEEWRRFTAGSPGPDIDGDGVPDLFDTESQRTQEGVQVLTARSGATGRVLWSCELEASSIIRHEATDDFNGDGVHDLLVVCAHRGATERVRVAAVCGKTGRVLWQSPGLTGTVVGKTHNLLEHFVFLRPVRLRPTGEPAAVGISLVSGEGGAYRYHAFALSGANGRILWNVPVGPTVRANGLWVWTGAPAVGDLDGDGVNDLVFWAGPHHLVALSGVNGNVLWEREVLDGAYLRAGWRARVIASSDPARVHPPPALADLDGKGTLAVAYVHRPADRDRTVVLNGKDGTERWAWEGPVARKGGTFGAPADSLTEPRFIHLREGTFLLAVACGTAPPREKGLSPGLTRHLVLLDAAGKEYQRRELPGPPYVNAWLAELPLWVADLDGDGFDAIAFRADDASRFIVTRGGLKEEAWSLDLQLNEGVLSVRPARAGKPGTVVFRTDTTVRGFDGSSGRALWACTGPGFGSWLPPTDPAALPLVLFRAGVHGIIARRAVPLAADGKFIVPGVR